MAFGKGYNEALHNGMVVGDTRKWPKSDTDYVQWNLPLLLSFLFPNDISNLYFIRLLRIAYRTPLMKGSKTSCYDRNSPLRMKGVGTSKVWKAVTTDILLGSVFDIAYKVRKRVLSTWQLLSSWDVKRLPTHEEHSIQLEKKEDKAVRSRSQGKEETISTLLKLLKDNPNTACTSAQDLAKK